MVKHSVGNIVHAGFNRLGDFEIGQNWILLVCTIKKIKKGDPAHQSAILRTLPNQAHITFLCPIGFGLKRQIAKLRRTGDHTQNGPIISAPPILQPYRVDNANNVLFLDTRRLDLHRGQGSY